MTHLWAAHVIAGVTSVEVFVEKKSERYVDSLRTSASSVSKELSSRQIRVRGRSVENCKVMVIGLWSDSRDGSMVALVRNVRSFWDRKKWSIREYLLCGGEKKVKSFSLGCRVRQVSWSRRLLSCCLMDRRALYVSEDVPLDVSTDGVRGTFKSPPTMRVPE